MPQNRHFNIAEVQENAHTGQQIQKDDTDAACIFHHSRLRVCYAKCTTDDYRYIRRICSDKAALQHSVTLHYAHTYEVMDILIRLQCSKRPNGCSFGEGQKTPAVQTLILHLV